MAKGQILQRHQKYARNQLGARRWTDGVQRRTNRIGGGIRSAPYEAAGISGRDHQRREVKRLARDFGGFDLGDAFCSPAFVIERRIFVQPRRG